MEASAATRALLVRAAALARIHELTKRREAVTSDVADRELKAATREVWALGDYHRFAKATVWERGAELVTACGVSAGQRVLDVAAGSGNTSIPAAEAGAQVVASDLTPENFEAGRREARERSVEVAWIEADAESLPFADEEFDVVTSSFGALFAPDHHAVADEMVRVCRPGGTIGMLNFTPEGLFADFLAALAPYAPAPAPDALPPALWGSEQHVRDLLGDRVEFAEMSRRHYYERAASPAAYVELFKQNFGPVVAIYRGLAEQPDRMEALDNDFHEFATRANSGPAEGPAEYRYDYMLVVARKRPAS